MSASFFLYWNDSDFGVLTQISLASFLWDIGKQCRPRSDAAERGVWWGSTLFFQKIFLFKKKIVKIKYTT